MREGVSGKEGGGCGGMWGNVGECFLVGWEGVESA